MSHSTDTPISRPRWHRYRWWIVAGAVALVAIAVFGPAMVRDASQRSLRQSSENVTVATAQQGLFYDVVPLNGKVQPRDVVYLDAVVGGQVREVLVQPGDRVAAGQPLVLLRNAQLELDVQNNIGRLIESITQLQSYETQLENNRANNIKLLEQLRYEIASLEHLAQRYDPLARTGSFPKSGAQQNRDQLRRSAAQFAVQADTNRRQETLRREQLPGLRREQASVRKSLAATESQLDYLVVRSPVAGTVTQLNLKLGESRDRGARLGEIVANTGFLIVADVDEFYLGKVRAGQTGTVTLSGRSYNLVVSRIRPEVKNGAFQVELQFAQGSPPDLTVGAAANGTLTIGAARRALVLPAGAFLEASGGSYVFVLDADGETATRRPVRLGRRSSRQVEVLAGLTPGERVIVSTYANYARIDRINLK